METFTPSNQEPAEALLDAVIGFFRTGHPVLHSPAPPSWAEGDPCPAGHFLFPEGIMLYRSDVAEEAEPPYVLVGIDGDCERHVLDDDRIWNIPLVIHFVESQDTYAANETPQVVRDCQNDLFADVALTDPDYVAYPAVERLSTDDLHVYYFYDIRVQESSLWNGRPAWTLKAKVRCAGKTTP